MSRKVKSARGVVVDFDLIQIKEQMAATPPTIDVQKRQDFIESRLRRRPKKKLPEIPAPESVAEVEVEPELASVEAEVAPMIEEPVVEEKKKAAPKKKRKTTQKARPPVKKDEDSEVE